MCDKNKNIVCVHYQELQLHVRVPDDFDPDGLVDQIHDNYVDLLDDHIKMGYYFLQAYAAIDFRKYRREGDQTMKYKGFTDFCTKVSKCSRKKIYNCMHVLSSFGKRDEDGCLLPDLCDKAAGRKFSVLAEIAEYPDLLGSIPKNASVKVARDAAKKRKQEESGKPEHDPGKISCDLRLSPSGFDISSWPGKDKEAYKPQLLGTLADLVKIWSSQGYDVNLTFTKRKRRNKEDDVKQVPAPAEDDHEDTQLSIYDLPDAVADDELDPDDALPDDVTSHDDRIDTYCVYHIYHYFKHLHSLSDKDLYVELCQMADQSYGFATDFIDCHFVSSPRRMVICKLPDGETQIKIIRLMELWKNIRIKDIANSKEGG